MDHDTDGNTDCSCYNPKLIGTDTGRLENKRTSRDHNDNSIIKIGQNTEKSPGDLRRLAITQTPVRNYRLMLVLKTLKKMKNTIDSGMVTRLTDN